MKYLAFKPGSTEYLTTMQSIVDKHIDQSPRPRVSSCRLTKQLRIPTSSTSTLNLLSHITAWWMGEDEESSTAPSLPPVDRTVQLFQTEIEALAPFGDMSNGDKSKIRVALTFPGWLTESQELCQIVEAAERMFGQVFVAVHPSAVYTALGYQFCQTPFDAYDCQEPGRLVTIDVEWDGLLSVTLSKTPIYNWAPFKAISAVSEHMNDSETVEWIDSVISSERPDMVAITGPGARRPHLQRLIECSEARPLIVNHQSSIPVDRVTAMGAAQFAKDSLERQSDGCWELLECIDIRQEADRIAGTFNPPENPSSWSLVSDRNQHVGVDVGPFWDPF